jgi:hypothetical protein
MGADLPMAEMFDSDAEPGIDIRPIEPMHHIGRVHSEQFAESISFALDSGGDLHRFFDQLW